MTQPIFTYEEASSLLEDVRAKTLAASERLQTLRAQAEQAAEVQADQLKASMESVVQQWASEIMALGALPKGIFTVDFDSGAGFYFCWNFNEPSIGHFHNYEEGFASRKPLSPGQKAPARIVLN